MGNWLQDNTVHSYALCRLFGKLHAASNLATEGLLDWKNIGILIDHENSPRTYDF